MVRVRAIVLTSLFSFTSLVSFTGSYTEAESKFSFQSCLHSIGLHLYNAYTNLSKISDKSLHVLRTFVQYDVEERILLQIFGFKSLF